MNIMKIGKFVAVPIMLLMFAGSAFAAPQGYQDGPGGPGAPGGPVAPLFNRPGPGGPGAPGQRWEPGRPGEHGGFGPNYREPRRDNGPMHDLRDNDRNYRRQPAPYYNVQNHPRFRDNRDYRRQPVPYYDVRDNSRCRDSNRDYRCQPAPYYYDRYDPYYNNGCYYDDNGHEFVEVVCGILLGEILSDLIH